MSIAFNEQIAQLEAAIKAQEELRPTFGDAVVDASIAALRQQILALASQAALPSELASQALASLKSQLPAELAAKARVAPFVQGERRQVTLLFADLSGFTAVSEQADAEVMRAFQDELFGELARVIYQYEGFVEKFVGDAVLAIFGAPVAHEDDAERALRAALAIRERMAAVGRRWANRLGSTLTLHIGVNTGPVIAGTLGADVARDGAAAYAVTGDTVNTAARLQTAAQPGQILVSGTTYRLTQAAFTFRALEPIAVRNKREPLLIYELERARSSPGKLRGIPGLNEAFVGREAALQKLQALADSLTEPDAHAGGIVVISGEAGIGKSRLVAEWRARAGVSIRWLEGRCFAHTSALAYGPFLDMLRRFVGISDEDSDKRARNRLDKAIESLLPGDWQAKAVLAHLLAMRPTRRELAWLNRLPARSLRERIFSVCAQSMRTMLTDRPLILVMEDMQWSDSSSIELLESLLPLIESERMALVLVTRPERDADLGRLAHALPSNEFRDRNLRIELDRLSENSSLDMVRELLSLAALPGRLEVLVRDKAEGNPFFVEEIIRALIERGALTRENSGWTTTPLLNEVTETIPDTLQGLIMARIDRLPDESKDVVQHAAVIGRTFLYRVLLEIAEHTASLDADLGQLERTELIRERASQPEVEYMFQHALTQEVAYYSLLKSRRREIHRRVGQAMELMFAGRLAEHYAILAEHFKKGEVMDKSANYYLRAAEQASRMFSQVARVLYEQGLEQLELEDDSPEVQRQRIDATIDLAREFVLSSSYTTEDLEKVANRLSTAEELAQDLQNSSASGSDDEVRLARVYGWIGRVNSEIGNEGTVSEYLTRIQPYADRLLDAELAGTLGQLLLRRGRFAEVERVLAPALDSLPKERPEWIHANGVLAIARAAGGRYREAREQAEAGVFRARKLGGALPLVVAAQSYLGFVLILGGDSESLSTLSQQNLVDARRFKHPAGQRVAETLRCGLGRLGNQDEATGILNHLNGQHDDCEKDDGGVDIMHARDDQSLHQGWHAVFHAEMEYQQSSDGGAGDLSRAEELANKAVEIAVQRHDLFTEGLACRLLGQIGARQGSPSAQIDALMRRSRGAFENGGCVLEEARTLLAWGEIGMQNESEYPDARRHLREAETICERTGLKREQERIQRLL